MRRNSVGVDGRWFSLLLAWIRFLKLDPSEFDAVPITSCVESQFLRHHRRRRWGDWLSSNFLFARRQTFLYLDVLESRRKKRRREGGEKIGGAKLGSSMETTFCEDEEEMEKEELKEEEAVEVHDDEEGSGKEAPRNRRGTEDKNSLPWRLWEERGSAR